MPINLQKGQKIEIGLSHITVGLGWDPNEGTGHDFDLDASAIMLDSNRKLVSENHFIFYNNYCGNGHGRDNPCLNCKDGKYGLIHTGDDPTGGNSVGGDDESIKIDLSQVDARVNEILFVVTIHDAIIRRQNYGQVRNSYIRIVDDYSSQEVAKYELGEDFSIETAVEFGRLYKRNEQWKFEASGIGYKEDLAFFLSKYYNGQIIK
ncbi:TerD family protein [Pedobacter sp. Du54]|uniref:TerD family protein n=1 Tax=Pedobacter anseongensis TaxID=3133439 RepID=UPI0030B6FEB3